jgi:hypothetical protein
MVEKLYVIRCETKEKRRCGSGQVLTRTNLQDAENAAKTHSLRRGCPTSVYVMMVEPVFTCTQAGVRAQSFKPPKPREYDFEYCWS